MHGEIESEYEANTGVAIIRRMEGIEPLECPAILVAGHGPFAWGKSVSEAAYHAVIVEELAAMAHRHPELEHSLARSTT